jgi:hypothetical protein
MADPKQTEVAFMKSQAMQFLKDDKFMEASRIYRTLASMHEGGDREYFVLFADNYEAMAKEDANAS